MAPGDSKPGPMVQHLLSFSLLHGSVVFDWTTASSLIRPLVTLADGPLLPGVPRPTQILGNFQLDGRVVPKAVVVGIPLSQLVV